MKKLSITALLLAWGIFLFAQGIYNDGAHIVSTSGSYWVVDNGSFTLTSASTTNLAQFDHLKILGDAGLSIPSSSCLTVNGTLTNSGTMTMNSGSTLITNGSISNSGTISVKREIPENSKWHLITAPNNNTTTSSFEGYYLQEWDELSSNWLEVTTPGLPMPVCKGYALWDTPAKTVFSFNGTPNTGDQDINIYSNSSVSDTIGMNLIGNPYPSAIDWSYLDGELYGAVYVWNPTTNSYISFNNGTGDVQYIAPLQGFFIHTSENGTFNIGNDARTHQGNGAFYKSSSSAIENGLVLSTNQMDKLYIRFVEEAMDDFDFAYDAYKIVSLGQGNSQLYSKHFDTKLAIDCRPETEKIQLGYQNNENGHYSIELMEDDGISAELEDTKLNQFHNLSTGAYTFVWNTTDSEERFILHLKATGTNELEAQDAQVNTAGGQVYIRMNEQNQFKQVRIYDLAGRLIFESKLSEQTMQTIDMNQLSGAYLVQLVGKNQSQTEKVILK
jgi:hypothetical protein